MIIRYLDPQGNNNHHHHPYHHHNGNSNSNNSSSSSHEARNAKNPKLVEVNSPNPKPCASKQPYSQTPLSIK